MSGLLGGFGRGFRRMRDRLMRAEHLPLAGQAAELAAVRAQATQRDRDHVVALDGLRAEVAALSVAMPPAVSLPANSEAPGHDRAATLGLARR